MPKYSRQSKQRLASVAPSLQRLFNEVIKHVDCTVVCGLRTAEEQAELYASGRNNDGKIVTHCDGYKRKSRHQSGMAVDVVPYPIDWNDIMRFRDFAWFVKGVAAGMGIKVDCGAFWNFKDYPHYEVKT